MLKFILPLILVSSSLIAESDIDIALSSIHAAEDVIVRVQLLTHSDPDKACDLCLNAMKFLWNAEYALDFHQHRESSINESVRWVTN